MDTSQDESRHSWARVVRPSTTFEATKKENLPPTEDDPNQKSTSSARSLYNTSFPSELRQRRHGYEPLRDDFGRASQETPVVCQSSIPPGVGAPPQSSGDAGIEMGEMPHREPSDIESLTEALEDHTLGSRADSTSVHDTSSDDPGSGPEGGSAEDTRVPAFYCRECRDATRDERYRVRLFDLTSPLECHACNTKHRAVHFTARERANTVRRTCIARQGSRMLCSHWDVNLDDIRDWQRYLHEDIPETATNIKLCWGTLVVKCPHSSHQDDAEASERCPLANVRLYLWEDGVELLYVEARWESTPALTSQEETGFEACKRTIGQLHTHCPEAFGPAPLSPYHIMSLTPEDLYANTAGLTLTAGSTLYFDNLDGPIGDLDSRVGQGFFEICGAPRLAYTDTLTLPRSAEGDLTNSYLWSAVLNPASYGLGQDPLGRGITWCNDVNCATMRGRIPWEVLAGRLDMSLDDLTRRRFWGDSENPRPREQVSVQDQQELKRLFDGSVERRWQYFGQCGWALRGQRPLIPFGGRNLGHR